MTENAGHIQELALVEVVERQADNDGILRPINYSVVRSLKISPSFGAIWYRDLDFGFPSIDNVLTPYANASGSFDETRFHRERAVSMTLLLVDGWFPEVGAQNWPTEWDNSAYWVRELSRWVAPAGRYRLYWRNSGSDKSTYWCNLRGAGMVAGITQEDRVLREVQMNWVSSDGKIYLFNESYTPESEPHPRATKDGRTRTEVFYGGATAPGLDVPWEFPLLFPTGVATNAGVDYRGTISTGFTARIWGGTTAPTVDPVMTVTNPDGTVSTVAFSGLTVPANQFVEVDTIKMTVLMNGDPTERRENVLTAPLQFPQLQPGFNGITLTATSAGTNSYIEVLHFDAFLHS